MKTRWSPKKEKKRSSPKFGVFFCPKSSDLQKKKKKKKKVFAVIQNVFLSKKSLHQNSERFSVQDQMISKKKKVLMCNDTHFYSSSLSHDLLLLSPQLRLGGGLFSFLEQKSASELLKTCYFAYFSGQ